MRLNTRTMDEIKKLRYDPNMHYFQYPTIPFQVPVSPGAIHIHVRCSNCNKNLEMPSMTTKDFIRKALELTQLMPVSFSRTIIFTSDDSYALNDAINITKQEKWNLIYSKIDRLPGGFSLDEPDKIKKMKSKSRLTIDHLMQLLLALEADAWIGHRGSNWNRLIDELRCVIVPKCFNSYIDVLNSSSYSLGWR